MTLCACVMHEINIEYWSNIGNACEQQDYNFRKKCRLTSNETTKTKKRYQSEEMFKLPLLHDSVTQEADPFPVDKGNWMENWVDNVKTQLLIRWIV